MLDKVYDSKRIEAKWRAYWENNSYFLPRKQGEPYCIVLPPPNVTGTLHMGHGFQITLMDALIRYQRMCGKNVLWQVGTDHAGIATQMVVEQQLIAQGKTRYDLGRQKFVEIVWDWKNKSGGMITQQLRYLGASIDWSRERFTLDPEFSAAVQTAFVELYQKGFIYRGKRLVNWDPQLLTAVSDLEVVNCDEQGYLWTIRYPFPNEESFLLIATTRPETLFGDVAIAVHPHDPRFQDSIGKKVMVPLTGRLIPIIADNYVDPNFGTGCVKITPAHDFNDYALAQRHNLGQINIFTPHAHLNENVPKAFQGLERFEARKKIINELKALNLLDEIESHSLKIPRGDRSGVILEPYLTDQWFVAMKSLAKPAIEAINTRQIDFIPESWRKVALQWLENIEDWCISRQLWWGHRIPAWYDKQGQIYVGPSEIAIREHYALPSTLTLKQDEDVLDTWFSSALWPFASLGWPHSTYEFQTFYPTNVLVTGFDIIFFWVARMLMLGLHFTGKIPFKEVYVTGLIRDHDGQKMSKSKGNVLDPLDIIQGICLADLITKRCQNLMQPKHAKKIEQATRHQFPHGIPAFGTDALRFTYCALASPSRDIRFDLNRTEGYRNFCNKLWNAARFILLHAQNQAPYSPTTNISIINRAFYSRLQSFIEKMHDYFRTYRFDLLAQTIYEFIWNEYCDWYLEITKPILFNPANFDTHQETCGYLIEILEICLRLLHPLMPFITEEIWQLIAPLAGKTGETILLQMYPTADERKKDNDAELALQWLKEIVTAIRALRSSIGIPPGKKVPLFLYKGSEKDSENSVLFKNDIMHLAKLSSITWINQNQQTDSAIMGLAGTLEILIPIKGTIDIHAEMQRLEKTIDKLKKEIKDVEIKLTNAAFMQNAPENVVIMTRKRLIEFSEQQRKLQVQLEKLQKL
jgi:valyl-tRNA synthetase